MANYFVGDIQGCFNELSALLQKVDFSPSKDCLWAVGDLVARGTGSLETLRYLKSLDGSSKVVLGNHDLHLLAVKAKIKRVNPSDNLESLLNADDIESLTTWLRQQPLYRELPEHKIIMTHAGVPPSWDLSTLKLQANKVSEILQSEDYLEALISKMYTDHIDTWHDELSEIQKAIYCINGLTRMRYLYADGTLDFACKQPPQACNVPELSPWFSQPSKLQSSHTLVFGHWAALMGATGDYKRLQALDTGCCWGEHLTLWHLESDEKIIQPALQSKPS